MKRHLLYLTSVILLTFCYACDKEYSYEGGLITAEYTVKDSSGYCFPTAVAGILLKARI